MMSFTNRTPGKQRGDRDLSDDHPTSLEIGWRGRRGIADRRNIGGEGALRFSRPGCSVYGWCATPYGARRAELSLFFTGLRGGRANLDPSCLTLMVDGGTCFRVRLAASAMRNG